MKKLISLLLVVSMALTAAALWFTHAAAYTLGDASGDGKLTAKDSLLMKKFLAGNDVTIIEEAADINADGHVTTLDLGLLKRHLSRGITIDKIPITDKYLANLSIFDVSLENYTVIVPANADVFTMYAAEILVDEVEDVSGITMEIKSDETAPTSYEFLIGETNREESARVSSVSLEADEYILKADGYKVVMQGENFMIGGAVGALTYNYIKYNSEATGGTCNINNLPTDDIPRSYEAKEAKSAILMIGDGMGPNHEAATLAYNRTNKTEPAYKEFSAKHLPVVGSIMTASLTTTSSGGTSPTDSAAAGTALACGIKTYNGYLGLNGSKASVKNIRELSAELGKRSGVITTELKEGATPSAFTVHHDDRKDYTGIAALQALIPKIDYLKGDINDNLLAETKYTLDLLSTNNEKGFFVMIEEANIDTGGHQNNMYLMTHCMARFNSAVEYAMVFAASHPDCLLVVTADHETGGVTSSGAFTTKSHTTVNVPLYAIGDGSESFVGTVDNTLVPKVIAANWGVNNFGS